MPDYTHDKTPGMHFDDVKHRLRKMDLAKFNPNARESLINQAEARNPGAGKELRNMIKKDKMYEK